MIDTTPKNLMEEVDAARATTRLYLANVDKMIRDYTGRWYRQDKTPEKPVPEPTYFEWLAQHTDQVVYDNPRVVVNMRSVAADWFQSKALQHGLNRWCNDIGLWGKLLQVWFDSCFSFGVLRIGLESVPGFAGDDMGRKPQRASVTRIRPARYFRDARNGPTPRFEGHMWTRDKADLLKDKRFDRAAVQSLSTDAGWSDEEEQRDNRPSSDGPDRREINGYEIWCPEIKPKGFEDDDTVHGTIFTLGKAQNMGDGRSGSVEWIRKPRPFYGPKEGPYVLFGNYLVPDEVYPLSIFAAIREQVEEVNAHVDAAAKSARNYKKFVAVDATNPKAAGVVKQARHGSVVLVPGLGEGKVQQMESGGVSPAQYDYIESARARRDRTVGFDDAGAGMVSGSGTATEHAEAAAARNSRISMIKKMFQTATKEVLKRAGWYHWHTERVVFDLGAEAAVDLAPRPPNLPPESEAPNIAMQLMQQDPTQDYTQHYETARRALMWQPKLRFRGGMEGRYDDLELTIDAMSMERVNEPLRQKRALEWIEIILKLAPAVVQFPWIKWVDVIDQAGDALNETEAGDILDPTMIAQMQQQQAESQQAMMAGQPAPTGGGRIPIADPMNPYQPQAAQQAGAMMGNLNGQAVGAI